MTAHIYIIVCVMVNNSCMDLPEQGKCVKYDKSAPIPNDLYLIRATKSIRESF